VSRREFRAFTSVIARVVSRAWHSPRRGDAEPATCGQGGRMGCLLAVFAGMFPRFALIIFWIARPERMDATFTTFLWPLLGIIFLPFTTLIYVLLWSPGTGVTGSDWLWIALAVFLDLAHWSASASQRNAVPRGSAV